ncbi:hypothetical protein ONZ51_g8299 [Trametes cubensis]|uniref:Velvet domain-containing protein n=1 Tax=Trametes cubensis TaxID=1111947 RepID=A0AAD7TNX3_9APHY|nr:hypothetical protein ONZ51_g8299 [Trametes cubensis]
MSTSPTTASGLDAIRQPSSYPVSASDPLPSPVNGCTDALVHPLSPRAPISRQRPRSVFTQPRAPVTFATGVFARRTIRVQLEEIQKADLGRKYACRLPFTTHPVPSPSHSFPVSLSNLNYPLLLPLIPPYEDTPARTNAPWTLPPVVICRFFNLVDRPSGPPLEIEIDPEQVILGAICHVDLFPIPEDVRQSASPVVSAHHGRSHQDQYTAVLPPIHGGPSSSHVHSLASTVPPVPAVPSHFQSVIPPMSHLRENAYPLPPLETLPSLYASLGNAGYLSHAPVPPMASLQVGPQPAGSTQPPALPGVHNMMSNHAYPPAARHAAELALDVHGDEVVAWFGAFPIYENSKCTTMLSGATFMQSAVIDYEGKKTAMFVFSDLAVKIEGTFVLRYRAFTLFSECAHEPRMPILAECFGGPFKIYSTKEFPGLLASTELTKRLAMHGVRVNLRENPRRRRKKREIEQGAHMSDRNHAHDDADERDAGAEHDDLACSESDTATTMSPVVPSSAGFGTSSSGSPIAASFLPSSSMSATSARLPTDSTFLTGGASTSSASVYSGSCAGASSYAGTSMTGTGSGSRMRPMTGGLRQASGHPTGARGMRKARGASASGRCYAKSESSMDE